jgi:uncharacterized protein
MAKGGFVVNVADLLNRPGARRRDPVSAPVEALRVVDTEVAKGTMATVDAVLEWVSDGILATGTVSADWTGQCRRCLKPVEGRAEARFQELFEPQSREGETYPLLGDRIDLGPLAQETLLLELPLAPLCKEDCAGLCPTCGADLNAGPCGCEAEATDPRWAALDALREDLP